MNKDETAFWKQLRTLKPTTRLEIGPYLKMYTPVELLCKKRYLLLDDPVALKDFIDSIPQSIIQKNLLPFPERLISRFAIDKNNHIYQVHTLGFSENAHNIYVEKHVRYLPPFIHQHNFFEIMYVYTGHCKQVIANQSVTLQGGDVCLIAPFVPHRVEVTDDSILINIHIKSSTFQSTFFDLLENSNILSTFFNRVFSGEFQNQYLLFHSFGDTQIREKVDDLILEFANKQKYFEKIMDATIQEFFGYLLRGYEQTVEIGSLTQKDSKQTIALITYIQNNFMDLNLSDLAHKFHYSSPYLSKLIKKQTGQSFVQLTRGLKLKKARFMLETSSKSIQEIAFQSGFNSSEHFIRTFKQEFQTTPSAYRESLDKSNY